MAALRPTGGGGGDAFVAKILAPTVIAGVLRLTPAATSVSATETTKFTATATTIPAPVLTRGLGRSVAL